MANNRIMCGDATNHADVAALFGPDKAALIVTSPPYLNQRAAHAAPDWTQMMIAAFTDLPLLADAQVFVNLGLIHRNYDILEYERDWLDWMREQGWRRSVYIWDKTFGSPGRWSGRLGPAFEFLHHFQKTPREPNKIIPKQAENIGQMRTGSMGRWPNGDHKPKPNPRLSDHTHKISDNVIRIPPCNSRCHHPSMFPVALPKRFIESYTVPNEIIYDPFAGSGTTLLAAHQTGRIGLMMERDPCYVALMQVRLAGACGIR